MIPELIPSFLHPVLQVSGHWVHCGESVGRSVVVHHCGGHRGLWGQLPGALHVPLHPGNLLHSHLPHLHLWNLCQAREGKSISIHFIHFIYMSHIVLIFRFMLLFWMPTRECLHALILKQKHYLSPVCSDWPALTSLSRHRPPCVCISSAGGRGWGQLLYSCDITDCGVSPWTELLDIRI